MQKRILVAWAVLTSGVLVASCGSGDDQPSGPKYASAQSVAQKLELAKLGCESVKPPEQLMPTYGDDAPDAGTCTLTTSGTPAVTITVYESPDALRGFLTRQRQGLESACDGPNEPPPTRQVEGGNFVIEGPLDEMLAAKLMAATGGSETTFNC